MKLIGIRDRGRTLVALMTPDGRASVLTDADSFYADPDRWLSEGRSRSTGEIDPSRVAQAPALPSQARIFCVGLNYRAHAAEGGYDVPDYPTIFGRWSASLSVDGAPVMALDERLDWEGELAVVIGRAMTQVDEAQAAAGVLAYAPFNDISARTYQRHTSQWTLGKNADGSGPIGALVTADEVGDPAKGLRIVTRLNDQIVQDGNTRNMIFSIGRVISYISQVAALKPGDVIATGTPDGVGHARTPPLFMKPGDVVEVEIERVGSVRNPIVAATGKSAH
jgi:2,4-diketo-3-deoxy-L-fuconate hydrolase